MMNLVELLKKEQLKQRKNLNCLKAMQEREPNAGWEILESNDINE